MSESSQKPAAQNPITRPAGYLSDKSKVFKIGQEFLKGYEKMMEAGPCISVFGSSRLPESSPYYALAERVARKLAEAGFGIITGGGPGLMEAANKGAQAGGKPSIGLTIQLPHEKGANAHVDAPYHIDFKYFFARKVMFVKYAKGFVVFPGGMGTLDELFESLTLIQTGKVTPFPIVLMGTTYWKGLIEWMKESMLATGTIGRQDLDLFLLTDDPARAVQYITDFGEPRKLMPEL